MATVLLAVDALPLYADAIEAILESLVLRVLAEPVFQGVVVEALPCLLA